MAVRVNTPHSTGVESGRTHSDAVDYRVDDGLLRVRGESGKQIAVYNRDCWTSAVIVEDERRTEYGDIVDRG